MHALATLQPKVFFGLDREHAIGQFEVDHGAVPKQFEGENIGRKMTIAIGGQAHVFGPNTQGQWA